MAFKRSSLLYVLLLSLIILPTTLKAEGLEKDVHIVVKGDTLWDISETYLQNPFLWPKLWQWNDYIMNPHFIYPGDKIRLQAPARAVRKPIKLPVTVLKPETKEEVIEEVKEGDVPMEEVTPQSVVEGGKYNIRHLRASGMISASELSRAGSIIDAQSNNVMISVGDIIYLSLKEPAAPGDLYSIFKPKQQINHPITKAVLGNKIEKLGRLEVITYSDNVATAKIIEAFNAISRGDPVRPWVKLPEEITIRESAIDLDGYIVTAKEETTIYGQGNVVYIDLGTSSGLETGNTFIAYKPEYIKDTYTIPAVTIGRLLVFEVKEDTSSAIIVDSIREMRSGTKIKTIVR